MTKNNALQSVHRISLKHWPTVSAEFLILKIVELQSPKREEPLDEKQLLLWWHAAYLIREEQPPSFLSVALGTGP